jgi:hypothetical protein
MKLVILQQKNRTCHDEASNCRNETRQERIEREGSNQKAIGELDDTSDENVAQVDVNELDFARLLGILLEEYRNKLAKGRHGVVCS